MSSDEMAKLTKEDIRGILKRASSRDFSVKKDSEIHGLTERIIQQQTKIYCDTVEDPTLNPNRRLKTHLSDQEQKAIIDEFWEEIGLGVRLLFYEHKKRGYRIPHNKIHPYLRETDRTTSNPRKQKKRKRCRYEREHSGSMSHATTKNPVLYSWFSLLPSL
jgi:putative transposase